MNNPSGLNSSGPVDAALLASQARARRYALRSQARDLLVGSVQYCGLHLLPSARYVSVRYSASKRHASVTNLVACGSVWTCAVCAARITELRRRELEQAITAAREKELRPVLLTLTIRHHAGDYLRALCEVLLSAWRAVVEGRAGMRFRSFGLVGFVRALEVTHGAKGWHPHLHVLLFVSSDADLAAMEQFIREQWGQRAAKLGHPVTDVGVDLRETFGAVADYVAKFGHEPSTDQPWGVSAEMAKWPVKVSRRAGPDGGGATPLELLAASMDGDRVAATLFVQYAQAMKGRRQLVWSRGLRELLSLTAELSDQEAAQVEGEDMPEVARLTAGQWQYLYRHRLVAELLTAVEEMRGDRAGISLFLLAVGCPSPSTWVADPS